MAKVFINMKLLVLVVLVFLLSGCVAQDKLRWLDNKIGEIIFSDQENKSATEKDTASSTEKGDFQEVDFKDLTREQKKKIDEWLKNNGLNRYGDTIGVMYAGGTPLFNEKTGEAIDRFEHILKKIPDMLEKIE